MKVILWWCFVLWFEYGFMVWGCFGGVICFLEFIELWVKDVDGDYFVVYVDGVLEVDLLF